ncbi:helix-turn-helix domain-containing protein [candidate division KSB1 bacterium]
MKIELEKEDREAIAKSVVELLQAHMERRPVKDDAIFDVNDLAAYLKVSKQWVYQRVHTGSIPYYKIGKYPRFRKVAIDDWMEQHPQRPRK